MMTTETTKPTKTTIAMKYGEIYVYIYIHIHTHIPTYIHTHTYIHMHIHTHLIYIYTHIHLYIHTCIYTHIHTYIHIAMINPSNAPQTIVTLPQIKDILATTTATTIVKIKARKNNT